MKILLSAILFACITHLISLPPVYGQLRYAVIDLGIGHSTPTSINNSGNVVGYKAMPGENRAYIWRNGVITYLNHLGIPATGPLDINNHDQVVGYSVTADGAHHAVLWDQGIITDLGTLGGLYSAAHGINENGQIVGSSEINKDETVPFIWENGQMSALPLSNAEAVDISDNGEIVGTHSLYDSSGQFSTWRAFTLKNGIVTKLPIPDGFDKTKGVGLNESGVVAGISSGPGRNAPCRWENGVIELSGLDIGTVNDINDSGAIVGVAGSGPGSYPYLWTSDTLLNLNTLVDSGWSVLEPSAINNRGEIAARATRNGQNYTVLLTNRPMILRPRAGERWIGGEMDTIRWTGGSPGQFVNIEFSADSGATYSLVDFVIPADSGSYIWTVPDTLSTRAKIRLTDYSDSNIVAESGTFRIKGYALTNVSNTNEYIAYDPTVHRWGFRNTTADVWPLAWYTRFNYRGTDPFTGESYSQWQGNGVFASANSSDHPDWESFVRTFGTSACYWSTNFSLYSPTALARWASAKGVWGGSCFGIAISNAIAFRNYSALQSAYPDLPPFTVPINLTSDSTTIPMVNALFTHQFGNPHVTYRANVGLLKTPLQTLNDIKAMCLSETAAVRTLSMLNNGPGGGGHAILAYKVKKDPVRPTVYNVYVYDNSWSDSVNAKIDIDTALNGGNGGWTSSFWPGWGGAQWLYLRDPAVAYLATPTLPKGESRHWPSPFFIPDGLLDLRTPGSGDVRIMDSTGNVTGYVDSLIRIEIPGSAPMVVENGSKTPPYGYTLPLGGYNVELSDFTSGQASAFFFAANTSIRYERADAQQQQTDRLRFDGSIGFVNHDPEEKEISLETIVNEAEGEKVVRFSTMRMVTGDSLHMLLVDGNRIRLTSFGQPRSFRMRMEFVADSAIAEFLRDSLALDPNTAYTYAPDWLNLGSGGELTVFIDEGNDGTIDDTISYPNQLTGVGDESGSPKPDTYTLAQNYPNPFNAATVIEYGLPVGSQVTLRVYDILGREVATLVDEYQSGGFKQVRWDASGVPSGVYYVRMTAGAFAETRKILLLR